LAEVVVLVVAVLVECSMFWLLSFIDSLLLFGLQGSIVELVELGVRSIKLSVVLVVGSLRPHCATQTALLFRPTFFGPFS